MFLNPLFTLLSSASEFTCELHCSDLCKDFQENIGFHLFIATMLLVRNLKFSFYLLLDPSICTILHSNVWPILVFSQNTNDGFRVRYLHRVDIMEPLLLEVVVNPILVAPVSCR